MNNSWITIKAFVMQLFIISLLISTSLSYLPCRSLETLISSEDVWEELLNGCLFYLNDTFKLPLLLHPSENYLQLHQVHFDHPYLNDNIQFSLYRHSENNSYTIETIQENKILKDSFEGSTGILDFQITDGVYNFFFRGSALELSEKLKGSSPYILTNKISVIESEIDENFFQREDRFLLTCPSDFFFVNGSCTRVCPKKYYKYGGLCWKCSDSCSSCITKDRCNPCQNNNVYFEEKSICVEKCPDTYFRDVNNNICVKCAEGCTTCTYPHGSCSKVDSLNRDIFLSLACSSLLFLVILLCGYYLTKENQTKKKRNSKKAKNSQNRNDQDLSIKNKSTANRLSKIIHIITSKPYDELVEGAEKNNNQENQETDKEKNVKKLSEFAQSKLSILMVKKFKLDDSNDEKAIIHGSVQFLPKTNSALLSTVRPDSPVMRPAKYVTFLEDSISLQTNPELVTSPLSYLSSKKSSFLELAILKKNRNISNVSFTEPHPQATKENEIRKTVVKGDDRLKDKPKDKGGYKSDSSVSLSKENQEDESVCMICGVNNKDCRIMPCGHILNCYACIKKDQECYRACAVCKSQIQSFERLVPQGFKALDR